jgi:hypothetical protein
VFKQTSSNKFSSDLLKMMESAINKGGTA